VCRLGHCICLQEQEADYSPTLFSDMIQFALSNGTPTVAKSSESEPPKDGFPVCMCSRETFGCSTHPTGKEKWIASMRDSLASLTPLLENARATLMIETSGRKSSESLGRFTQDGFFLKMCRDLFQTDLSETSSVIWPASGMMRDGRVWELTRLAPRTGEKDGSLWPTLTASPRGATTAERNAKRLGGVTLESALARWESPTNRTDGPGVHGGLNPNFLEWFMGFPIGWTEKKRSETRKSRYRRPLHSKS
jgi:hypothetical protein